MAEAPGLASGQMVEEREDAGDPAVHGVTGCGGVRDDPNDDQHPDDDPEDPLQQRSLASLAFPVTPGGLSRLRRIRRQPRHPAAIPPIHCYSGLTHNAMNNANRDNCIAMRSVTAAVPTSDEPERAVIDRRSPVPTSRSPATRTALRRGRQTHCVVTSSLPVMRGMWPGGQPATTVTRPIPRASTGASIRAASPTRTVTRRSSGNAATAAAVVSAVLVSARRAYSCAW